MMQIQQTLYSKGLIVYSNTKCLFKYLQIGDTINFTAYPEQQQICSHLKNKINCMDIMFLKILLGQI